MGKTILLMYISEHSGHHQASLALEKAILSRAPESRVYNVNALKYTNPVTEKVIHKTYMGIIKKRPDIWGYLYDNPEVVKKTEHVRNVMNKAGAKKIGRLIDKVKPDAIGCTQAFPCVLAAQYKNSRHSGIPLVGILTDYAPHAYWIHKDVDIYIVPSSDISAALMEKGIPEEKIKPLGTPIDPLFEAKVDKAAVCSKLGLSAEIPVILIMGGTQGMGPCEKLVKALEGSKRDLQIIAVAGVNKKLFLKLGKIALTSVKKLVVLGFAKNVHELMEISDVIISKPGGLTSAEALAKSLPMIILNSLPGQEELNAKILIGKGAAVRAIDEHDAAGIVEKLLDDPGRIKKMRRDIGGIGKPRSAADAAELLLKLAS